MREISPRYVCLLLFIIGFSIYANSLHNEFIWDDEHLIIKNRYIKDFSYVPRILTENQGAGAFLKDNFYRPIQLLLYSFVYIFSGLNPFGYHLLNIFLHIMNSIFIYFIFKELIDKKVSFIASLLFVVHPVHTEAVTYISGTADPLSVFFALGSVLLYIKNRYVPSLILFGLALFSKETMIVFPLLFIAIDIYRKKFNYLHKYVPFFIISISYFILRLTVLNFGNILNFYEEENIYTANISYRIMTFFAALATYYKLLVLPLDLHMERSILVYTSLLDPIVFWSMIFFFFLILKAKESIKKEPILFLSVSWFFISFIPVSGVVPINALILEHWLYLPSIGAFVFAAYSLSKIKNQKIFLVLILSALIFFSIITVLRNFDWKDPITFYTQTLRYAPDSARVHNNLAMAYSEKNMSSLAIQEYKKAIKLSDIYPQTHYNLGNEYLKLGHLDKAIKEYEKALEIDPDFFYAHKALFEIYSSIDNEKAKYHSQKLNRNF